MTKHKFAGKAGCRYEINRALKKPKRYEAGDYKRKRELERFLWRAFLNDSINAAALDRAVYGDKEGYNELYKEHSK